MLAKLSRKARKSLSKYDKKVPEAVKSSKERRRILQSIYESNRRSKRQSKQALAGKGSHTCPDFMYCSNRHCCQLHSALGAKAAVDVKQEDRVVKREEDERLLLLEDENLCLKRRIFELEDQLAEQAETIQAFQTSSAGTAGLATHRALQ